MICVLASEASFILSSFDDEQHTYINNWIDLC